MNFKEYLAEQKITDKQQDLNEATEDKKLENGFIKKTINAIVQNKLLSTKDRNVIIPDNDGFQLTFPTKVFKKAYDLDYAYEIDDELDNKEWNKIINTALTKKFRGKKINGRVTTSVSYDDFRPDESSAILTFIQED
jgi:hypothetical protein